jgi:ankyrin repeat protein
MNQSDIDAFVDSASWGGTLTPEGVTASVEKGIPVNGRDCYGNTALHCAVYLERHELVAALLAAGASANVKDSNGWTSVWWGAWNSTADILQLLIDGGGSVNEAGNSGETPLVTLVWSDGDAVARLRVLLARPELDLDVTYEGKTAEQWAEEEGHFELAAAIEAERVGRQRWSDLRSAWVAATVSLAAYSCNSYDGSHVLYWRR